MERFHFSLFMGSSGCPPTTVLASLVFVAVRETKSKHMISGAFEADQAIVNISGIHKDVRLTRERELHTFGMCMYNERIVTIQIMSHIKCFCQTAQTANPVCYIYLFKYLDVDSVPLNEIRKASKVKFLTIPARNTYCV